VFDLCCISCSFLVATREVASLEGHYMEVKTGHELLTYIGKLATSCIINVVLGMF
jgi:hypothetical protein